MNLLITGCSSGFGELMAKTLTSAGHRVFAGMRDIEGRNREVADGFRQWAQENSADLHVVELDVTDDASVQASVAHALEVGGTIDVLVNNAAIASGGPLEAFTIDQMKQLYETNIFGQMRMDQAVLPHMRERGQGLIIQFSSTLGRVLPRRGGLYPASKWAIEGLTESLRYDVEPFGVEVIIVEPGSFPTPATSRGMRAERADIIEVYAPKAPPRMDPYGPNPPDPQMIADAVLELVDMPHGTRPFRNVVGTVFTDGVAEYNATYEQTRDNLRAALDRLWD